jgi:hypothetical protein
MKIFQISQMANRPGTQTGALIVSRPKKAAQRKAEVRAAASASAFDKARSGVFCGLLALGSIFHGLSALHIELRIEADGTAEILRADQLSERDD